MGEHNVEEEPDAVKQGIGRSTLNGLDEWIRGGPGDQAYCSHHRLDEKSGRSSCLASERKATA